MPSLAMHGIEHKNTDPDSYQKELLPTSQTNNKHTTCLGRKEMKKKKTCSESISIAGPELNRRRRIEGTALH